MAGPERLSFPGSAGTLAGRMHIPAGRPRAYALFAHCFTGTGEGATAVEIADTLAAQGVAVLGFDFNSPGEGAGDLSADLVAAADHLRREYRAPELMIGHDLAGAAVLAAAPQVPECTAVATLGAPAPPAQLSALSQLRRALLICHAPRDVVVGIDHARQLYQAARHPKSFLSLDDADHLLSNPRDAEYAARVIAAWAGRYVGAYGREAGEERAQHHAMAQARIGEHGYATFLTAGGHPLQADEPIASGGTDTGPNPYDLLLAALGACTAMTLRMYADRKEWPLEGVDVALEHSKIHAQDCEDCGSERGRIDRIDRRIHLLGPLDEGQRQRLIDIANKCPVHRTLQSEVSVITTEIPE